MNKNGSKLVLEHERMDVHKYELPAICYSCEARHRGMCGVLEEDELIELARHSRQVVRRAGEQLISDSETIESYASVMRGVVKLSKVLEDGRQQVVGLQFSPDFLGRLFGRQSAINADAASEVELCRMPKSVVERMVAQNPALEGRLLEQTLRELDEAREWMVTLGRKTAKEKVASFLYLIATHKDPASNENSTVFDLPLTRADIADFLGLTIETVSRQFTKLRASRIIEIENHRHVLVADMGRLKNSCG
ncbi:Fnr-type transcriptional regulator [hydrothermal vent metagenome]|uniref:Fnr-type transcriptional regulator n=1 Tax=hydrothermal vent metagenome TaxID=652676 RepID=A0A3B0TSD7_9ZZZZ